MKTVADRLTLKLFLVSLVGLFWEMLLIRWISNELPLLSYFRSLVILGAFLGLGLGCIAGRIKTKESRLLLVFLAMLAGLAMAVFLGGDGLRSRGLAPGMGVNQQSGTHVDESPEITMEFEGTARGGQFVVIGGFVWVAVLFFPLGVLLGRWFGMLAPLRAYLVNIVGSLLGTLLFTLVSFSGLGPDVWWTTGFIPTLALLVLVSKRRKPVLAGVVVCAVAFGLIAQISWHAHVIWSPYQRISWRDQAIRHGNTNGLLRSRVYVNYQYHQQIVNFTILPEGENKKDIRAMLFGLDNWRNKMDSLVGFYNRYETPYWHTKPQSVLIVAGGVGNEAAAALRNGAREIDCVEIEPGIIELGRRHHPEEAYNSERVRVICDDARAFLQRSKKRYDLIVMNAVDSHSQYATTANLRLDSYIFTLEFFEGIREHLKEDGVFAFEFSGFHWRIPWCRARLQEMVWRALGYRLTDAQKLPGAGGPLFLIPKREPPAPSEWGRTPVATDDWPQFYLKARAIPRAYQGLILVVFVVSVAGLLAMRPTGMARFRPHFFFLGAAFMLLEIKSITELSLIFGNTWLVISCVITSILLAIAVANLVILKFGRPPYWLSYAALLGSLVLGYVFAPSEFLGWPFALRGLAASVRVVIPIFAAGLVFGSSFKEAEHPGAALGWNLMGAMVGGLGEYLCLVVGVSAMGPVAIVCYGLSMLPILLQRKVIAAP